MVTAKRLLSFMMVIFLSFGMASCGKKQEGKLNPDNIEINLKSAASKEEPITYNNVVVKPKRSSTIKKWTTITAVTATGIAVTVASAGSLAPAAGTWIGTTFMGLHGIAATNAGLALLGGGAVGTVVITTLADLTAGYLVEETISRLAQSADNKFHKQAQKELELKNNAMAISLYRESIANREDLMKSYFAIGTLELSKKNYPSAISTFNMILKYSPNSSMVIYQLGLAQLLNGNINEGIDTLKTAINKEPNWDEPYIALYQAYIDNREEIRAFETLMSGVKINPESYQLNYQAGMSFSNKADWNAAISYFSTALKYDDKQADAFLLRGLSYQKIGKKKEALDDFLSVSKILKDKTPYGVNINIGEIYLTQGNKEKSIEYFKLASITIKELQKQQPAPELNNILGYLDKIMQTNKPAGKPWWKVWG